MVINTSTYNWLGVENKRLWNAHLYVYHIPFPWAPILLWEREQKDCRSQRWWINIRKQCFLHQCLQGQSISRKQLFLMFTTHTVKIKYFILNDCFYSRHDSTRNQLKDDETLLLKKLLIIHTHQWNEWKWAWSSPLKASSHSPRRHYRDF